MPAWLRKPALILAACVAAVLVVLGGFVAFLHAGPGERWLSGKLEENVAGLELDAYHLNWPFRMRADYLRLSDSQGVWLQVTGPELKWHPLRLWRRALDIDRLAAREITVFRLPEASGQTDTAPSGDMPDFTLRLRELSAPITLAEPVLGQPLRLDAGGWFLMERGGGAVDLHVNGPDGAQARVAGTAGRDFVDLRWYVRLGDLARWQRLAGVAMAGELSGSGFIAGRLPNPVVSGEINVDAGGAGEFRWNALALTGQVVPQQTGWAFALRADGAGLRPGAEIPLVPSASLAVTGDVDPESGHVRLGLAELAAQDAVVTASGVLADWGRNSLLRLKGRVPDPAALGVPVKGGVHLRGQVAGDLLARDMWGALEMRMPGFATGNGTVDGVVGSNPAGRVTLRLRGDRLDVLSGRLGGTGVELQVQGRLDQRLQLWANLSAPGLSDLSAAASLRGPPGDPTVFGLASAFGGSLGFDLRNLVATPSGSLAVAGHPAGIPVQGRARLNGMVLEDIALESGATRLTGHVNVAHGGAAGRLLASVPDLSQWQDLAGVPLTGEVEAVASVDPGSGQSMRIDVTGRDLAVAETPLGEAILQASLTGLAQDRRQAVIERLEVAGLAALSQPARITVAGRDVTLAPTELAVGDGRIGLEGHLGGKDVAAHMTLQALPLQVVRHFAPGLDVAGDLDGTVTASGTVDDPRVAVDLTGRQVGIAAAARAGVGRLALRAQGEWQAGQARGRVSAEDGQRVSASAEGNVATAGDGALSVRFQAAGDAGRLTEALPFPAHVLAGRFEAAGEVTGTLAVPQIDARAAMTNGRYENLETGTLVTALSAEMVVDHGNVTVTAQGMDGGNGSLLVRGTGAMSGAYGADVTLERFTALRRDDVEAQLSGNVRLEGTGDHGRIAGRLTVPRAEVDVGRIQGGGPVTLNVVEINKPGAPPPAPPRPGQAETPVTIALAVDVGVEHAFVRGRGLDSEWQGDVSVAGTLSQPSLTGQIKVARGTFDFLGKQFTLVQESSVTFQGGDAVDPSLNITAETSATDITAQVLLTGTAKQPSFAMSSVPSLPQDEVLARVLFGRELGKLSTFQQIQLAQMAASGLTGAGGGGFDPIGDVRGALGLDVLGVGSEEGEEGGPTLSAGKYLGPDTFLRVDQGTAGLGKVTVEQGLGGGFSVESSVGAQSGGGVGFNWRKDY